MYYRRAGPQPPVPKGKTRGRANLDALKALVTAGKTPGLIAYRGKIPVGWISFGPREEFERLKRSPVMKPVDDRPVWSIICFVVPPEYRGQGIGTALLKAAIAYARKHGATIVEAYPVDKPKRSEPDNIWFGAKSMYDHAGFEEVARRKPNRPVVRLAVR
jgi:GNAT superfamily N-acetyltransferase